MREELVHDVVVDVPALLETMPLVECDVFSGWQPKLVEDELVATHVKRSRWDHRGGYRHLLVMSQEVSEVVGIDVTLRFDNRLVADNPCILLDETV